MMLQLDFFSSFFFSSVISGVGVALEAEAGTGTGTEALVALLVSTDTDAGAFRDCIVNNDTGR